MIDKIAASVADALAGVQDGATVLIGGFGTAGTPGELIDGLIAQGARELTLVCNNAGNGEHGVAALIKAGRVRKIDMDGMSVTELMAWRERARVRGKPTQEDK